MFPTLAMDFSLFTLLNQQWRTAAFDVLLPIFSQRWPLLVLVSGVLVWRCMRRGKEHAVYFIVLLVAMGLSDFSTNQIKHAVGRLRPVESLASVYYQESGQWLQRPVDFAPEKARGTSFPSAHAANTAALALLAALMWRRVRPFIWAVPLLVGWSRVYLGKHYPTDVLAGWILGALVASLCWLIWRAVARRLGLPARAEQ